MKSLKLFFLTIALFELLLLAGCTMDNCPNRDPQTSGELILSSNIVNPTFRAYDNTWEKDDMIGIYMITSGKTLSTATPEDLIYINRLYKAESEGIKVLFKPNDDTQKMFYPTNIQHFDLISYYPSSLSVEQDFTIKINTAQNDVPDLLYSNNITTINSKSRDELQLKFAHMLSAMRFYLVDASSSPITSAIFKLKGLNTTATFHLDNGTLDNIAMRAEMNLNSKNNAYNAIVIPQVIAENTVSLEIVYNGQTYSWIVPKNVLEKGKRITYHLKLNNGTVEELSFSGTITDWIDVDGGTHELSPDNSGIGETTLNVSPDHLNLPATNATGTVQVNTNAKSWTFECADNWVNITKTNNQLSINLEDNLSSTVRSSIVKISAGDKNATVSITQQAKSSAVTYTSFLTLQEKAKDVGVSGIVINEDMAIQGVITNDPSVGMYPFRDFYFIQSEQDNSALIVTLPKGSPVHFDRFTQITVDNIKGCSLKNMYGSVQLELNPENVKQEKGHVISPRIITIPELLENGEKYVFQYVKFENVQFENYLNEKFYDGTYSTKRHKIIDPNGKWLSLEIYKYCKFKDDIVPQGSGSCEVIINKYITKKGKTYYNPRPINKESFDMNSPRF